ncbi:hypothetical protein JCM15415_18370 [Methanobacterium movens]
MDKKISLKKININNMQNNCQKCDFCDKPAVGKCLVCGRCYCQDHLGGDGYCVDDFFGSGLF